MNFHLTRPQLRFMGHRVCPRIDRYWQVNDIILRCWTGRRFVSSYISFLRASRPCRILGDINTATLTFDNYTVDKQAFLLVTNTSSFSTDITSQGYSGLVGKRHTSV